MGCNNSKWEGGLNDIFKNTMRIRISLVVNKKWEKWEKINPIKAGGSESMYRLGVGGVGHPLEKGLKEKV